MGIIVCGLNGAGKSVLGKALAERLRCRFIDNEDLFFPRRIPVADTPPRAPGPRQRSCFFNRRRPVKASFCPL